MIQEKIQDIKSVFPSSTSLKLFVHLVQEVKSGHYRQFDYGAKKNNEVYGRPTPPDYDLSKVTVPMSIIHGNYDHIARIEVKNRKCLLHCSTKTHKEFAYQRYFLLTLTGHRKIGRASAKSS
jgi:hypothetical protein